LALAIAVFAGPILQILGAPAFLGAVPILPLLLLSLMLAGVQRLLLASLHLEGSVPARLRHVLSAVAALSLTGNLLLVPRLGIWGAAVTAVLAQGLLCGAALAAQRRHRGVSLEVGRLAKVMAALCSTYYISRFVMPEPLLGQLAAGAAMLFLYPALLGVLGFYTMAEVDKMRDLLNRRVVFLPERTPTPLAPEIPLAAKVPPTPELVAAGAEPKVESQR
jgi:O-antigen/teichoic acid export membrane protein